MTLIHDIVYNYFVKEKSVPKRYSSVDLVKIITKDGWFQTSKKGSHLKFKHKEKVGIVIIPHPKKDIPAGTAEKVLKMAGLKQ